MQTFDTTDITSKNRRFTGRRRENKQPQTDTASRQRWTFFLSTTKNLYPPLILNHPRKETTGIQHSGGKGINDLCLRRGGNESNHLCFACFAILLLSREQHRLHVCQKKLTILALHLSPSSDSLADIESSSGKGRTQRKRKESRFRRRQTPHFSLSLSEPSGLTG